MKFVLRREVLEGSIGRRNRACVEPIHAVKIDLLIDLMLIIMIKKKLGQGFQEKY